MSGHDLGRGENDVGIRPRSQKAGADDTGDFTSRSQQEDRSRRTKAEAEEHRYSAPLPAIRENADGGKGDNSAGVRNDCEELCAN
jgi:hypothetical protein